MRRLLRDDSGQGMFPLMLLVAFSLLAITFSLLVPWGSATTEKSQAQTAADAAALAALDVKRDVWLDATAPPVLTFQGHRVAVGFVRARGCEAASSFASQNDATVTGCGTSSHRGRSGVEVDVRALGTSGDNGLAEAGATAVMDIRFAGCRWDNPLPEPLTSANGGPPTFDRTLVCGRYEAGYRITNLPPYSTLDYQGTSRDELFSSLEPWLAE